MVKRSPYLHDTGSSFGDKLISRYYVSLYYMIAEWRSSFILIVLKNVQAMESSASDIKALELGTPLIKT